jgi:hypothetical protein
MRMVAEIEKELVKKDRSTPAANAESHLIEAQQNARLHLKAQQPFATLS